MIETKQGWTIQEERDGKVLFLDPQAPNWMVLNQSAADVLALSSELGEEEAARHLGKRWGVRPTRARKAVDRFKKALAAVNPAPEVEGEFPGRGCAVAPGRLGEMWLYTNHSCNLRCTHCFMGDWQNSPEAMTTEEVKSALSQGRALGVQRFYFTGGEPFLRKDILELIAFVTEELKSCLVILSNGTLIDSSRLKGLRRFSRKRLGFQISLEGPTSAAHDAIRGEGQFHKAVGGVRNLLKLGFTTTIATVLTLDNAEAVVAMPAFLRELGTRLFHVHWLYDEGRMDEQNAPRVPSPAVVLDTMRRLGRAAFEHGVAVDNLDSLRKKVHGKPGRKWDLCGACVDMVSVDLDGSVYACAPASGRPELRLGSLENDSLADIWKDSSCGRTFRATSVVDNETCGRCDVRFWCGGGCLFRSFVQAINGADLFSKRDDMCAVYYGLIDDLLWESNGAQNTNWQPRVLSHAGQERSRCDRFHKTVDLDWDVATSNCTCFLGADLWESATGSDLSTAACFDDLAPEYDAWADSPLGQAYGEDVHIRLVDLLEASPGDRILEVGCGTGNLLLSLPDIGVDRVGVDSSDAMLRIAHQKARKMDCGVQLEHACAEALPFDDASFDAIYSVNALEFAADQERAVREMVRVLKPGGRLILAVLNRRSLWGAAQQLKRPFASKDNAYYRGRFLTRRELHDLVSAALGDSQAAEAVDISGCVSVPPVNGTLVSQLASTLPIRWAFDTTPRAVLFARCVK